MARPKTGVNTTTFTVNVALSFLEEINAHCQRTGETRAGWLKRLAREDMDRQYADLGQ